MSKSNKITAFRRAMQRYHRYSIYHQAGTWVAWAIIFLQLTSLIQLGMNIPEKINGYMLGFALFCAYWLTDFINGFAHLYMDNNTNYHTLSGPYIAAFHLHHLNPTYAQKNPVQIYFYESGSKFWLVFYLLVVIFLPFNLGFEYRAGLVVIGILSSFAEVSHYWCHRQNSSRLINMLQQTGILLSEKHHRLHHCQDNKNYAFLNGMSNPLLNKIAKLYCSGYQQHADIHVKSYRGYQTKNRDYNDGMPSLTGGGAVCNAANSSITKNEKRNR